MIKLIKMKKGLLIALTISFILAFSIPFNDLHTHARSYGVIVIDPGHDAGDTGAIAPDGTQERYLNAQLAYKLGKELQSRGYDVTLSHTISYATDVPQDLPYVLGYQPTKYDILHQLVPAIESKNPDMAISIHQNSSTNTSATGIESYWRSEGTPAENHIKSSDLGTFTTNQCRNLGYIHVRPNAVQDSMFLVCRSHVPSILFESGFMSNPAELANLKDSGKQSQMAHCLANGIDDYFNKYPSTHVDVPATFESAQIIKDPKNDGIFTAVVYNVQSPHGIKSVQFPYWEPGSPDVKWVNGYSIGNNAWAYTFNTKDKIGTWNVHIYAMDNYNYQTGLTTLATTVTSGTTNNNVLLSSKNKLQDSFTVVAQNLQNPSEIQSVLFPTFAPGKPDAKWFTGAYIGNNTWAVTINISNFDNNPGEYSTHVYKSTPSLIGIGSAPPVNIEGISYNSITASNYDPNTETFKLAASGVTSPAKVTNVLTAVWSDADQGNLVWYNDTKTGDGSYELTVDINNHKRHSGTYQLDTYVQDSRNVFQYIDTKTVKVDVPQASISVKADNTESHYTITGNSFPVKATQVLFPTWNADSGSGGSAIWYSANKINATTWQAVIPISDFKMAGNFRCDAYATINGNLTFLNGTSFSVTPPSAGSITASDNGDNTFNVSLQNVTSPAPIQQVLVAAWKDSNQDDLHWYSATGSGNTWSVQGNLGYHLNHSGTYKIDAYVADARGIFQWVQGTSATFIYQNNFSISVSPDSTQSYYTVTGTSCPANATQVLFPTWNADSGSGGSAIWYSANKINATTWQAVIPISDFKMAGNFRCDAYATINGNLTFLNGTSFSVTPPSAGSITASDNGDNTFNVSLQNVTSPAPIQQVLVAAWKDSNQDDLHWYSATGSGNTWSVQGNLGYHLNHSGTYKIDAYVADARGIFQWVQGTTAAFTYQNNFSISVSPDSTQSYYTVTGTSCPANATQVLFPTWNADSGSGGSAIWYCAKKMNANTWQAVIPISDFKMAGNFRCDAYATINGNLTFLNGTAFSVTPPSATELSMNTDTDIITLTGVTSPANIVSVSFPTWHEADQSDIYWYPAQNQGNNVWAATFNPINHKNHSGTYYIHAYVTDARGIVSNVKQIVVNNVSGYTTIMGGAASNANQMANYFQQCGRSVYPYANDPNNSGASDIAGFAQIYIEEGNAEGVRGDIAFCQAMKETGWLKFTGDVRVNQYNFCGLGATGGGNPGCSFANVREGIRAHIQHLKAYGSTLPLNQACVDPRFKYVSRGCAPYVESLGGKWAPSHTYGVEIVAMYNTLLRY